MDLVVRTEDDLEVASDGEALDLVASCGGALVQVLGRTSCTGAFLAFPSGDQRRFLPSSLLVQVQASSSLEVAEVHSLRDLLEVVHKVPWVDLQDLHKVGIEAPFKTPKCCN